MVLRVFWLGVLAWDFGLRNNGDLGTWFYGLILAYGYNGVLGIWFSGFLGLGFGLGISGIWFREFWA